MEEYTDNTFITEALVVVISSTTLQFTDNNNYSF